VPEAPPLYVVTDVAVDGTGSVYIGGYFDGGSLGLEGTVLQKQDPEDEAADGFVARYDAEGRMLWAGHAGGEGAQHILALDVSEAGDLFVAGAFEQTLFLGPEMLRAVGDDGSDLFVARYGAATITSGEQPGTPENQVVEVDLYPNPFSTSTGIRFSLPEPAHVSLIVYDLLGRQVARLEDRLMRAGSHRAVFDASRLPGGVYFYRLQAGASTRSGRMVRVK
jgi:hypothetical protein